MPEKEKSLIWVGSSKKDLGSFPEEVRRVFGYALHLAQQGDKHPDAKLLAGFHGGKVLEVVENYQTDTYRAVYTAEFMDRIYVLHCFQKKSKRGAATPKPEIDLVKARQKDAERIHKEWVETR